MRKYALILIELFKLEMLNGVAYPVCIEMPTFETVSVDGVPTTTEGQVYMMLEYTNQPDPTGEGWVIFDGEDSNVKCSRYIIDHEG